MGKQNQRRNISFGLSNKDCRHKEVIDMLEEHGFQPLSALKDDQGFDKLNWYSHFIFKTPLEKYSSRNELRLTANSAAK